LEFVGLRQLANTVKGDKPTLRRFGECFALRESQLSLQGWGICRQVQ
jgi:hypothetical protein